LIVGPWGYHSINRMPSMSQNTEVICFPAPGLLACCQHCQWKHDRCLFTSGAERETPVWQTIPLGFCEEWAAHGNSAPFFPFVLASDPLEPRVHKLSSSLNVHEWLRACFSWWCRRLAAQLMTCGLLADSLDWVPSWQFHAHSWKFPRTKTLFWDLEQLLHTWLPVGNGCQQLTHHTRTMSSTFVHGIHLPLSTTAHHWLM
jgi:hypothetical protein